MDSLRLELPDSFGTNNAKLSNLFQDLTNYDLHAELSDVSCPALIVHGDADVRVPGALEQIRDSFRNGELIVLENCGHFPFVESPEVFLREIRAFLAN